jgi:hypothetical protein
MENSIHLPPLSEIESMRNAGLGQMEFARTYTLQLLDNVSEEIWQQSPQGIPTHFAWQVGHLAIAQYGLMLFRQRGRVEGDLDLMPGWFRKRYGRGSSPTNESATHPCKTEMLAILEKIHRSSMDFMRTAPAELLAEPTDMPFAAYPIKLGAFLFCPLHESIHAGQIGLLRRAHGLDPVR